MYASVIIAAAGKGSRLRSKKPKQYLLLDNIPILTRTLLAFESCASIHEIILVIPAGDETYCAREIIQPYALTKISAIVVGASTRQESVYQGLLRIHPCSAVTLVHDGVRPFIKPSEIDSCVQTAQKTGGCVLGVPVKDTIKICNHQQQILATPNRRRLWRVQTPQAFLTPLLIQAYEKAQSDGYTGTDDSALVERLGQTVSMISGSYRNIKITTEEDLLYGAFLLKDLEN